MALHGEIGPVRTTVSAIAERAGVERHTYYRHFPDDRSLFLACSGWFNEHHPMPDPATWQPIADPQERLRHALGELYDFYARNEQLMASVSRDEQVHALTAEVNAVHMGPAMAAMRETLAAGLAEGPDARLVYAALDLALAFATWRTLARISGLREEEAATLMALAVVSAAALPGL